MTELASLDEKWLKLSDHLHKRLGTWLRLLLSLPVDLLEEGSKPFTNDAIVLLEFDIVKDSVWNLYKKMQVNDIEVDFQDEFDDSFNLVKSTIFKAIETVFASDKATKRLLNSGFMEDCKEKIVTFLYREVLGYVTDTDYRIHDVKVN